MVDAVIGDDTKGRVIVLRSLHEPGCWLFAFRGVRVGEGRGFELDKEALLQRDVQLPEWLRGATRLESSVDEVPSLLPALTQTVRPSRPCFQSPPPLSLSCAAL